MYTLCVLENVLRIQYRQKSDVASWTSLTSIHGLKIPAMMTKYEFITGADYPVLDLQIIWQNQIHFNNLQFSFQGCHSGLF